MDFAYGDRVQAKPGSASALWADGADGVIAQSPADWNGHRGLVRWNNGERILMGFNPDDIERAA